MRTKGEILIAEDERTVLVTLSIMLQNAGYSVCMAKDGDGALKMFERVKPDLVLLDVMMPKMDGFAVCRKIRETDATTPVLFLTALGDEKSQLEGFGCGADDYMLKTLPEPLFLARVAAALRRTQLSHGCFPFGSWTVCADELTMCRADGRACSLTDRELAFLRLFVTYPHETLSRDYLLTHGWRRDVSSSEGALYVAINGLRKKLQEDGAKIVSVHGVGYVYSP